MKTPTVQYLFGTYIAKQLAHLNYFNLESICSADPKDLMKVRGFGLMALQKLERYKEQVKAENATVPIADQISYDNHFARNLKALRAYHSFSLKSLSNNTGIDQKTISKWENGDTEPSLSNLIKLSRALAVPVGSLITSNFVLDIKEIK